MSLQPRLPVIDHRHINHIVAASAVVASVCYYLFTKNKSHKGLNEIPSPKRSYPVFGHLFSLGKVPGDRIAEWHNELGPIIKLNIGAQVWVIVSNPQMAHELFSLRGSVTSARPSHFYFNDIYSRGGRGIVFVSATKRWKKTRATALKFLSAESLKQVSGSFKDEADIMVDYMLENTKKDGSIDSLKYLQLVAFNVIMSTCFGKRYTSIKDPQVVSMFSFINQHNIYARLEDDPGSFFPYISWILNMSKKKKTMDQFITLYRDELFSKLIKEAVEGSSDCFVKRLYSSDFKHDLEDEDIIVMMSDIVIAGSETTAVAMAWLFAVILMHPEMQTNIQAEIDAFCLKHGRLPEFSEANQLPYLCSAQKESLRYRSITTFGLPHEATEDVEFNGYHIPKGAMLIVSMKALHMDPNTYKDPEKFIPERFIKYTTISSAANGPISNRDQYNFGWGRRICPGIHLAEMEMFEVSVRLFSSCDISLALDKDGNQIPIDLDGLQDFGLVDAPLPYEFRVTERSKK
ncbi:cytochrome P450 [Phycomyces nitens]|nr:cytochrome P450 [Phycomyces nitens]